MAATSKHKSTDAGIIDIILDEIAKLAPESGYNLVGIDCYKPPGECFYLIGHFDKYWQA
jgi:hypothetical protein